MHRAFSSRVPGLWGNSKCIMPMHNTATHERSYPSGTPWLAHRKLSSSIMPIPIQLVSQHSFWSSLMEMSCPSTISRDLVTINFHLIGPLKKRSAYSTSQCDDEMKTEEHQWMQTQTLNLFSTGIE
jgi:hypothetical protein